MEKKGREKMKQKIWPLLLAMVLLAAILGGCGNKGPQVTEYGEKPPLESLSWGMNIEDALKALHLTEDDVTISTRQDVTNMALGEDIGVPGLQGKVSLQFAEPIEDAEIGLYAVTVSSQDQDMGSMKQALDEKLGSEGQKDGDSYVWETGPDQISAIPQAQWTAQFQEWMDQDESAGEFDSFTAVTLSETTKNDTTRREAVFYGKPAAYSVAAQRQAQG